MSLLSVIILILSLLALALPQGLAQSGGYPYMGGYYPGGGMYPGGGAGMPNYGG